MTKPLFRWTVGNVSSQGLKVLAEAAFRTPQALGKDTFDWLICSNATEDWIIRDLIRISERFSIPIYQQSWSEFPLDPEIIPRSNNIEDIPGVPSKRQGSFWKMCPLRLRPEAHEIVCDNDLIFVKSLPQIKEFLSSHKTLLSREDAHSVGKYFHLFGPEEIYNSGLYGMPPGYDFETEIKTLWQNTGAYKPLISRDEQGLISATLKKYDHIVVPLGLIPHIFRSGRCVSCTYGFIEENGIKAREIREMKQVQHEMSSKDYGYHFLGANEEKIHPAWRKYQVKTLI